MIIDSLWCSNGICMQSPTEATYPKLTSAVPAVNVQVCRDAASTPDKGGCDVAEKCDGLNKQCPPDVFDTGSVS
jgi:hypothetical protein